MAILCHIDRNKLQGALFLQAELRRGLAKAIMHNIDRDKLQGALFLQAELRRGLAEAILHYIDRNKLQIATIEILSTDSQAATLASKSQVGLFFTFFTTGPCSVNR